AFVGDVKFRLRVVDFYHAGRPPAAFPLDLNFRSGRELRRGGRFETADVLGLDGAFFALRGAGVVDLGGAAVLDVFDHRAVPVALPQHLDVLADPFVGARAGEGEPEVTAQLAGVR